MIYPVKILYSSGMVDSHNSLHEETQIVDAEILPAGRQGVSADISDQEANNQSQVLLSLDELIKTHIASLDRLQTEKKELQDMVADGLNNDATFKEISDKAKAITKEKAEARKQIMNRPGVIEIVNKLKNITSETKEKNMALSDYLLEYQKMAGVNQIEGYDGEVREIVQIAKLVKRASKKKD